MAEFGDDIKPKHVEHDQAKDDAPPSLIHSIMDERVKDAPKPSEKAEAEKSGSEVAKAAAEKAEAGMPHDRVASITDTMHQDADWLAEHLTPTQIAAGLEKSLQSAAAKIALLTAGGMELPPVMGPSFLTGLVTGQDSADNVKSFMKTIRNYIEK